jgi:hypothetical protein
MMRPAIIYIGALLVLDIVGIMLNWYAVVSSIVNDNWLSLVLSSLGLALGISAMPSLLRLYRRKAWTSNRA